MPNLVTETVVNRITLVKRGAVRNPNNPSEPARRLLWKAEKDPEGASAPSTAPKGAAMTPEETQAALAKAEKERDEAIRKQQEAEEALAKASAWGVGEPTGEEEDDDDTKGTKGRDGKGRFEKSELPEAARVAFEKQERELAELRKAAEKAEEIAKQERTLREEREFIAKAETEFTHLGKAEELGPELMRMKASLSKEDYDRHLERLAAANEQIAKGAVFREYGVSGSGSKAAKDGLRKAHEKAEELRKADTSLTPAKAFERAMADPTIAKAYAAEMGR